MKIIAEIVAAIFLFALGAYIAPKMITDVKIETLKKVDRGLPSLEAFSKKLTK